MSKKKEVAYSITPKGVVYVTTKDEQSTQEIMDALELVARRKNCNAILINDRGWDFVNVTLSKGK